MKTRLRIFWGRGISISCLCLLWATMLALVLLTMVAIPLCYLPDHMQLLMAQDDTVGRMLATLNDFGLVHLLTIDRSGGTMICLLMFVSVLIRYREQAARLNGITTALDELTRGREPEDGIADDALRQLRNGLDESKAAHRVQRVEEFHNGLSQDVSIERFEGYLVAVGLIGTLLAFYLGFAEKMHAGMDFASLDSTARELLTVVGTAAVSSVAGIGLGMIFVRALVERQDAMMSELWAHARAFARQMEA